MGGRPKKKAMQIARQLHCCALLIFKIILIVYKFLI